jgi:prepilin-type N-terminal cleavage/methylation domain-containing protein
MRASTKQPGFSIVELVIVVAVIGLLGVLGYVGYNTYTHKTASTSASQAASTPATASDVASAPAINSTSDLDAAAATLDQTDPSGSNNTDASQLDAQAANF